MLFSQRKGLKPAQKALQLEVMDNDLLNSLWNVMFEGIWRPSVWLSGMASDVEPLFRQYWLSYFKARTDSMPTLPYDLVNHIRTYFFNAAWNERYDFLEFTLWHCPARFRGEFRTECNAVLERENSAYRIVGNQITEITSQTEIAAVDQALMSPVAGANMHLEAALSLMSDRKKPDYRNSIKESISAVESICRALTDDPKATLGSALAVLESKVGIHGALKAAFGSLYGYTSDQAGIRHAMLDEPNITFSDAKFMLLACSAFINYVLGKAAEANIRLGRAG